MMTTAAALEKNERWLGFFSFYSSLPVRSSLVLFTRERKIFTRFKKAQLCSFGGCSLFHVSACIMYQHPFFIFLFKWKASSVSAFLCKKLSFFSLLGKKCKKQSLMKIGSSNCIQVQFLILSRCSLLVLVSRLGQHHHHHDHSESI